MSKGIEQLRELMSIETQHRSYRGPERRFILNELSALIPWIVKEHEEEIRQLDVKFRSAAKKNIVAVFVRREPSTNAWLTQENYALAAIDDTKPEPSQPSPPSREWKPGQRLIAKVAYNPTVYELTSYDAFGCWKYKAWDGKRWTDEVLGGSFAEGYVPWPRVEDWARCGYPCCKGANPYQIETLTPSQAAGKGQCHPIEYIEPASPPETCSACSHPAKLHAHAPQGEYCTVDGCNCADGQASSPDPKFQQVAAVEQTEKWTMKSNAGHKPDEFMKLEWEKSQQTRKFTGPHWDEDNKFKDVIENSWKRDLDLRAAIERSQEEARDAARKQ